MNPITYNFNKQGYTDHDSSNGKDAFFSKFQLTLSPIIKKNDKFHSPLLITDNTNPNQNSQPITDQKKENSIEFLKPIISNAFMETNNPSETEIFDGNKGLTQKRSGDWLQVLACKNLTRRNYKTPNYDQTRKLTGDVDLTEPIAQ